MESGDDRVEQNREEEGEKVSEELSGPDPRIIHPEPLRVWAERKGLTADPPLGKSPSPSFLSHSDYDRHSMLYSSKTEEIRQAQIQAVITIPVVEKWKAKREEIVSPIPKNSEKDVTDETQKQPPKKISWIFSVLFSFLNLVKIIYAIILEIFSSHSLNPAYLRQLTVLRKREQSAQTYTEWYEIVQKLDSLEGKDEWKENPKSDLYDSNLIEHRLKLLRGLSSLPRGYIQIKDALRAGLDRNLGGIGNRGLHMHCRIGTKNLISDYVGEVCAQLKSIQSCSYFSLDEKYEFFFETRQSFGRTALLLSGGAALGMYHLGVVKALHEQGLLPSIISGASAGSIVATVVGVLKDEEVPLLWEEGTLDLAPFARRKPGSFARRFQRLFRDGVLLDVKVLEETCRDNIGDITFREAYLRTGKVINITVCSEGHDRPRLLNYLTSPNVLVWSAACASCALKFLYKPVELLSKEPDGKVRVYHPSGLKWSDGSVEDDLPMKRLSELFNVNHFIVSQVNPHVYPFIGKDDFIKENESLFARIRRTIRELGYSEVKHRVSQIGIFPLSFCRFIGSLANQTYRGDVTVVPKMSLWDFLCMIKNPDDKYRLKCIDGAEKVTWQYVSLIRCHTEIEMVLEECYRKCQKDLAHPLYSPAVEAFT